MILGIDPGPTDCGWVLYHDAPGAPGVVRCGVSTLEAMLGEVIPQEPSDTLVAIERVQAQGVAGVDVMQTCEVSSRLYQRAIDTGHEAVWMYRREVLFALDVTGNGSRDAMVRARLLEMHPGGKGLKRAPGPLYGLADHTWAACGVAVAAMLRRVR